ncbi:unnamed protein product [Caenorhabditis brenneri]
MSDTSTGDPGKPMEQPSNDLSEDIEQPSLTTDSSDEISTPLKNISDMQIDFNGMATGTVDYEELGDLFLTDHRYDFFDRTPDEYDENSPSLSDMPVDVVGLITKKLDYKEQLKLRKVSKSLRALVDSQKPACKSIQIECYPTNVNITFDDVFVMYTDNIDDLVADDGQNTVFVEAVDFKKVAFDDLASTLKNPRLQLEEFDFGYSFRFQFAKFNIDGETLDRTRDFLSKLEDFEYCRIPFRQLDDIEHYQNITGIPVPPNMSHYSIPDSDYCLEFSFASDDITIVKKICHLH